ncbi:NnrS family protein [Hoeflea sp. YIM 152468]|uniref:NnrS family protein n=1 Tax=Hoeflea sp. YIM 152468 TaxID=3031759 RepID=UPI0023DC01CB|nr:NnrS family protein [Hoeflea sp. YIM 152468]MDF1606893.1 NnrS family protein [Hoeflea sp. YIM 152468]
MAIPRTRPYTGPALLSYGFRPFFLLGALYSGLSILLWLPQFYGDLSLSTLFAPTDWHVHELYFGFVPAIATGFLFTAVPNWTGRMPLQGNGLLALVLLWIAGRVAVTFSSHIGWQAALVIDAAFLIAVAMVIAREIVAGANWRNLKVLLPLTILAAANIGFHLEAHVLGITDFSRRLATLAVITLIMLIGGRVVPSFTRNWLVRENPGRLPAAFSLFDLLSIAVAVGALALWTAAPDWTGTATAMAIAALVQFIRLARWAGLRTWRDPLVWMLHAGYLFVPIGFALIAAGGFWPELVSPLAGVHALGVGAVGGMTLAMMVRASRGHTGQQLKAGVSATLLFTALLVAAVTRIAAALIDSHTGVTLHVAAFAWMVAFVGFGLVFAPALSRPRKRH